MDYTFWLGVYVAGCVLTASLILIKLAIVWCINWISKFNVFHKNVKKLQRPEPPNRVAEWGVFIAVLLFEAALSWINVPIVIWQILSIIAKSLRESFTAVPEKIKELRFPLKNNPELDRESVWAYVVSLKVSFGEIIPTDASLVSDLNEIRANCPSLNSRLALSHLKRIGVVEPDVVARAISRVERSETVVDDDDDDDDNDEYASPADQVGG
jgi:hypothetical protein